LQIVDPTYFFVYFSVIINEDLSSKKKTITIGTNIKKRHAHQPHYNLDWLIHPHIDLLLDINEEPKPSNPNLLFSDLLSKGSPN
jgi:hypothetical protein